MFLSRKPDPPEAPAGGSVRAALHEIDRLLVEQQQATDALRARLLELEHPDGWHSAEQPTG